MNTDGANATRVFMQPSSTEHSALMPPTAQSGTNPYGLAFDPAGNTLYVTDLYNNRAVAYAGGLPPTTDDMPATGVFGQLDFNTAIPGAGPYGLNSPNGIVYHASTNSLWVGDSKNYRIVRFPLATVSVNVSSLQMQVGFNHSPDLVLKPAGILSLSLSHSLHLPLYLLRQTHRINRG